MSGYSNNYLDILMQNYPLSDEYSEVEVQAGGNADSETEHIKSKSRNKPFGGFPPLAICKKADIEKEANNKAREYSTYKTAVSIKSIMEKRRGINPF